MGVSLDREARVTAEMHSSAQRSQFNKRHFESQLGIPAGAKVTLRRRATTGLPARESIADDDPDMHPRTLILAFGSVDACA